MKRKERSWLRTQWLMLSVLAILLMLSVSAGMIGRLLVPHLWAQGWIDLLIKVPGALFWAEMMPSGSMFASFPPEVAVVIAVTGLAVFCSLRYQFHRARLSAEDLKRDLDDV